MFLLTLLTIVAVWMLDCYVLAGIGYKEHEKDTVNSHLNTVFHLTDSFLSLLRPGRQQEVNQKDVRQASILILQALKEFLDNHASEINGYLKEEADKIKLGAQEEELYGRSKNITKDMLEFVTSHYAQAVDILQKINTDFLKSPSSNKRSKDYCQAVREVVYRMLVALVQMNNQTS